MVISLVLATIMVGSAFAILGGVGNLTGGISAVDDINQYILLDHHCEPASAA